MPSEDTELKKAGLRVTLPRLKILQILEAGIEDHLSAEDIYQQLRDSGDDVGIATVYRVLTQFEAAGIIIRHNFANGAAVYELDRGGHHDHMVCTDSGAVTEFHSDEIEQLQEQIAADHGYQLVGHNLVLYVKPLK
ncbi:ferric iron uptake transcriptional regulator [Gammaproteobacteria bacterium LSUCC0057]|uniref:Ferric uptake regulation protein n=1 Tax=Gammaproteobacteria bacterium LSUCC0057 TaxID=2559237 RepID=A0A4Y8UFU7_9GAMM|nr:ferric iron uptake transcriptional regulator [Gammaproteobacteria bacterium LSUCC0057]